METATTFQSTYGFFNSVQRVSKSTIQSSNWASFTPKLNTNKISVLRNGYWRRSGCVVKVRALLGSGSEKEKSPIAPLKMESPVGQFLSQIMKSHPHLVPAAVDEQLQMLQSDRENENVMEKGNNDGEGEKGTELVLYRRIAEVKASERRKALEEILYALVVQKFMDANVSLVPSVKPSSSDPSGRVDTWPKQGQKLEELHSPEAFEMIKNHLSLILGNRMDKSNDVAEISKLRVGHVYAASVMYGYFLRRVDQRFQLEKIIKTLPSGSDDEDIAQNVVEDSWKSRSKEDLLDIGSSRSQSNIHPEVSSWTAGSAEGGFVNEIKSSQLRNYVMSFDGETLQKYATIRSKEAVSIIEKHTEALFGRPEFVFTPQGTIDPSKDERVRISFGGLKRLVLEAVTFGSFLWDVESHVDSRYHFVAT